MADFIAYIFTKIIRTVIWKKSETINFLGRSTFDDNAQISFVEILANEEMKWLVSFCHVHFILLRSCQVSNVVENVKAQKHTFDLHRKMLKKLLWAAELKQDERIELFYK